MKKQTNFNMTYHLILLIVLLVSYSSLAHENEYVPGLMQVKFKKGAVTKLDNKLSVNSIKSDSLKNYLAAIGFKDSRKIFSNIVEDDTIGIDFDGKTFRKNDLSKWYLISFDDNNDLNSVIQNILQHNEVEFACPVSRWKTDLDPNDDYFQLGYQTGLKNGNTGRDIHATQAWDYNTGRSDVKIAVIDAGVDYNHIDLDPGNRSRVIAGYDAADDDNNPFDDIPSQYDAASHGTSVAGVIGAITNNDEGVAGIMHSLQIVPVKVFATTGPWWDPFSWTAGSAYDPWVADGINYATNNGAKVINLSLGGYGLSAWEFFFIGNPVGEAICNAYNQGIVIIASAGNNNTDDLHYPSAFPGVIGVAAVNNNDVKTSYSNYGSYISVCAPGSYYQNYSTKRGNQYDYFGGTSCSAPMVSGSAGLIISEALDRGIYLTNDDVKHLLEASADKVPGMQGQNWHEYYGYGRINVGRALERLNLPYTVTTQTVYNSSGQLVWDSHQHQFYNNSGLPTGNYYGVKQYKVSGHITFPTSYLSAPYVWVRERECIGWNYANSNKELTWINISNVTTTGFDYETVIYFIKYNLLGQEINKYWPGDSSSLQAKIVYTVVGYSSIINVPQDYSTISAALSAAVSGQTINISNSQTLSSNLTVPTGIKLFMQSGAILNLNSFSIISTGGTITIQNGATHNPDIRLMDGTTIKGLYPSIASALSNASTGDRIYINNMTTSFSSNYSIPTGITYEFNSSNLSFGTNVQLRVLGGLKSNNTTFTRSGGSNWWGIRFFDTAISSNCHIENSTISYANYGLYAYYCSPRIQNNTISSCTYGVYLNNSGNAVVSTNAISGCTRGIYGYYSGLSDFTDNYITSGGASRVAGIQVYNATEPTIYNNTIEGSFTYGLDADHYSRPLAIGPGSQDYQGYNRIIGGQTATVYAHDHSESVLGTCFSSDGYAGYNTIYLDITTDKFAHIRAENYSNIIAQKNYWGDYPPSDFSADGTSSIDYSYPLSSDPGGGSSLGKILGGLLTEALNINILPFDDKESVETLWLESTELWQSLQYRKALASCDYILVNYPDSPYAPLAFLRSVYAKRALKSTDMKEYLQKYVDIKNLRTMALELLIGEDLNNKRFEAAVEKSKTVIKENPDTEAEYKAMFGLFNLYATDLEDKENAQTVLDVMKEKYADYGLTQMAQFEMGEAVDWQLAKPIAFQKEPEPEVVSILPDKFELKPNYPNPFNPTTNIAFALPEASNVQISIYDLTGREIWRSVKTNYEAGNHTLTWNGVNQSGANVVSGIYLVRMVSPKLTATQRIVLMK